MEKLRQALKQHQANAGQVFNAAFDAITKVISFLPAYTPPRSHDHPEHFFLTNVVNHPMRRLILEHGEKAKMIDNYGRKVICVGTHFGLAVVHEAFIQSKKPGATPRTQKYSYCAAPGLIANHLIDLSFTLDSLAAIKILSPDFMAKVEACRNKCLAEGVRVWDHISLPEKTANTAPKHRADFKSTEKQQVLSSQRQQLAMTE